MRSEGKAGRVFSRAFIELPTQDKLLQLSADVSVTYEETGKARETDARYLDALSQWKQTRALEVKYLNNGNTKSFPAYQAASLNERVAMLEARRDAFYSKHLDDYHESGSGRQTSGQPDGASGGYAPGEARELGERDAGDGRVRGDGRLYEFDSSAGVGRRVVPRLDAGGDARFPRGPGSGSPGDLPPDPRRDIPGGPRGTIAERRQHGALPDSQGTPSPAFNGMRGMCPASLWTASPHDVQCWCRIMHFTSWSTNAPYQRIACDGIAIASEQA
jgi:hypothetical protein